MLPKVTGKGNDLTNMKAIQLIAHGSPGQWKFHDVADPVAGPDEAVVRVRACGLNRLDLWLEEGGLPIPLPLPRIPGCEASGEILALGKNVTDWRGGDRVAVQSNLFCGQCEFCKRGEESHLPERPIAGHPARRRVCRARGRAGLGAGPVAGRRLSSALPRP